MKNVITLTKKPSFYENAKDRWSLNGYFFACSDGFDDLFGRNFDGVNTVQLAFSLRPSKKRGEKVIKFNHALFGCYPIINGHEYGSYPTLSIFVRNNLKGASKIYVRIISES